MEAPYTLADLPLPFDKQHGRRQGASVFSIRAGRKRKRHELVVGIDGESVNIYNVQTQAQQSSYAIPPQSHLACPPASIYIPSSEGQKARRNTFVVLADGKQHTKQRLLCITEYDSRGTDFALPVNLSFSLPPGTIVGVEAIPSPSLQDNQAPQVVVSYSSGENICVADNFTQEAWRQDILNNAERGKSVVEHVALIDVAAARKGLLKRREDIIAVLTALQDDVASLACFIIRRVDEVLLRLCAVNAQTGRGSLQKLDDITLPVTKFSTVACSWQIRAASSQVLQLVDGELSLFDLSSIVPKLKVQVSGDVDAINACTILSNGSVVALANNRLTLYDPKYGSTLAKTSLDGSTDRPSKKRKRDDALATHVSPHLHEFKDLRTVVAITENLVAVEISPDLSSSSRKGLHNIPLADMIGKGSAEWTSANRDKRSEEFESAIVSKDVQGLEDSFLKSTSLVSEIRTMTDDADSTEEQLWQVKHSPHDLSPRQKTLALDLLSVLFSYDTTIDSSTRGSRLRLRLLSRNLIRWLVHAEILSASNLSKVFNEEIRTRDMATALGLADPSFQLIEDVLVLPMHLPLNFLIECARLLIRSMDTMQAPIVPQIANNDDQQVAELELESRHAELELSNALATLSSGLEIRSTCMELILGRLHTFPQQVLTRHLRAGLDQKDLVFLINLLRIELADAGWTERYIDTGFDSAVDRDTNDKQVDDEDGDLDMMSPDEDQEPTPSNRAIHTIGNLFNAAVDAVGAAGWLVGLAGDADDSYNMIDALRAEISAALEGVYEAHALEAYLGDFSRYVASTEPAKASSKTRQQQVVTVVEDHADDFEKAAMPVGGRSGLFAAKQLDRNGRWISNRSAGQSVRERAVMKDRSVGLYQFERIRV